MLDPEWAIRWAVVPEQGGFHANFWPSISILAGLCPSCERPHHTYAGGDAERRFASRVDRFSGENNGASQLVLLEPLPEASLTVSLGRIVVFVRDVRALARFYCDAFGLSPVDEVDDEWTVLQAGSCQLALHRVGPEFHAGDGGPSGTATNVKLVFTIDGPVDAFRSKLVTAGVRMRELVSYEGVAGPLCDGFDPERNVFQIVTA